MRMEKKNRVKNHPKRLRREEIYVQSQLYVKQNARNMKNSDPKFPNSKTKKPDRCCLQSKKHQKPSRMYVYDMISPPKSKQNIANALHAY